MWIYVRYTVLAALVYLALTANLQISNIVVAVLVGALVTFLVRPERRRMEVVRFPAALWALARYIVFLSIDVIKSGVRVARIVLDPKLPIRPGIIAIPSRYKTKLGTALNAHAITITPGEMVVEIGDDGMLYTHCLDVVNSEKNAEEAQRTRRALIQRIFE